MAIRLDVIKSHFNYPDQVNLLDNHRSVKLNLPLLREEYNSPMGKIAYRVNELVKDTPIFDINKNIEKSREYQRELTLRQLLYLYPKLYKDCDFSNSIERTLFGVALSGIDQSLSTRYLVHGILYLETIEFLGTDKHSPRIEKALKFKEYGCFAMTEIGHGSNVSGAETVSVFNKATRQFVINSPTPTSAKWWIGAAGNTANMAVVFAQLIIGTTKYGIHAFVVRIRDEDHNTLPGVIIGDCGAKVGLPGIDNGFIIFKDFTIDYDCLLDRMSHINEEGKFKSSFKSQEKRFGIMLSGLTGGRCSILGGTEINMRNALTIAIRYSSIRKQFGEGGEEVSLISYQLHKYRLMPYLSKCFAARMSYKMILKLYNQCKDLIKNNPEGLEVNEMHALLSVFKYLNGRYSQDCIQECREACGGHGYSAYAGLGRLRENNDIHLTWDGDNNVLIQQCSKFILKNVISHYKGNPIYSQYITFMNATKPEITSASLKSPNSLVLILEYRTHYYTQKSTSKLQSNASNNSINTWNNTQVHHFQPLTIAFGELILAKELLAFTNKLKQACLETGNVLEIIFKLYCTSILEKDHIGLNQNEVRLIQESVLELCEKLSTYAVAVIDSIGVPDHIINSVIGRSDGQIYQNYTNHVESVPGVYDKPSWTHLIAEMKNLIG